MGRSWIALACILGLVACQPLYGAKPEKLHNPERKKKPPEPPEVANQVKYIEECQASFSADATRVRPDSRLSSTLVSEGDTALQSSQHAANPEAAGGFVKDAIDKYRNALVKDPYNVEATLQLAEAYDLVWRKGCALAMLRRLQAMSNHPKYQKLATPKIDEVFDNTNLFKGYRKDAISAVGR